MNSQSEHVSSRLTVAIPVGPHPSHKRWLGECLESVRNQTIRPHEILLVDDMAGLRPGDLPSWARDVEGVRVSQVPWRIGVAAAFNFGVAQATWDLVLMLGSDDRLKPQAIEKLLQRYHDRKRQDGYYWFDVEYMDSGEVQALPCNCAAVTKGLWRMTGGFAPEMAVGACDSMFISQLMAHNPDRLIRVHDGPLYEYRRHDETDTAGRAAFQGPIFAVRDILTQTWKRPEWGRFE